MNFQRILGLIYAKCFSFRSRYSIINYVWTEIGKEGDRMAEKRIVKRTSAVSYLNFGTIVIALFCLYLLINIVIYLNRPHLSIYEVQLLPMASDTKAEAVIIRNENSVKTGIAGFVNYYMRSGTRVSKGETVYSIDESRQIYNLISGNDYKYTLSDDDIEQIKSCISSFNNSYTKGDFSQVYSLKDELTTTVNSISDTYLMEHLNQILVDQSYQGSLTVHKAEAPGLVSYFSDSLDGLTYEKVSKDTFDKSDYKSTNLFDANLKEQGSTIYKLLSDESWMLVLKLTEDQYLKLKDKTEINFTIEEDGLHLTAPISCDVRDGLYIACISLRQYMVRYLNRRFLTVSLDMEKTVGLKIPNTAIFEKQFFMVPKEYLTNGGDQSGNKYGVNILKHDEKTYEKFFIFQPVEVYYEDDNYCYIDMKAITHGTFIYSEQTQDSFQVSLVGRLTGVYCVNKGFAQFRRINVIQEGKEFSVVENGLSYSIAEHDHIAKDAKTIEESQTIY